MWWGGGATSLLPLNCLNAVNKMSSIKGRCHCGALFNGGGGALKGCWTMQGRFLRVSTKGSLPGSAAAGDAELARSPLSATGGDNPGSAEEKPVFVLVVVFFFLPGSFEGLTTLETEALKH